MPPKITRFVVGDRVQTHPATDAWMSGDRYGDVVTAGRRFVHVKMDRSGLTKRFLPDDLLNVRSR